MTCELVRFSARSHAYYRFACLAQVVGAKEKILFADRCKVALLKGKKSLLKRLFGAKYVQPWCLLSLSLRAALHNSCFLRVLRASFLGTEQNAWLDLWSRCAFLSFCCPVVVVCQAGRATSWSTASACSRTRRSTRSTSKSNPRSSLLCSELAFVCCSLLICELIRLRPKMKFGPCVLPLCSVAAVTRARNLFWRMRSFTGCPPVVFDVDCGDS